MAQVAPTALVRGIRRWDLVAFGINFVVGAGIFGLPAKVYSLSGTLSLIAYAICAAAVFLIVLCFAEVGSRFDETGGPYLYAREAFGQLVGFEVGWLRSLAGVTSFAANSNLLVDYLSYVWPTANTHLWRALIITAVALSLTTINLIGVRDAALASNIFAVGKLLPLLLFVTAGLFFIQPHNFSITARPTLGALSTSVLLLVHAFAGFESVTIAAGEVRDPQRTVPFALFITIGGVVLLYVLIQVVCIGTLPELASSTRPLADAGSRFLGAYGGYIITLGAIVSIMGNLNGQLLVTPRTIFAMAEQKQLPRVFAAIHTRFHTPYFSICLSAAVILCFALSGTFIQLLTVSVLARLVVYASTCAALPVLRRKGNVRPPLFKAPAGIVVAIASVGLCVWLLSSSTKREALTTTVAAGVGLISYALYRIARAGGRLG
jgi:amino acid transporter